MEERLAAGPTVFGREVDRETSFAPTERVYTNKGNTPLIDLLDSRCGRVLDIGCGAGDNAALVRSRFPDSEIFGVTHSPAEAERALAYMKKCWVIDIEKEFPGDLLSESFDVLVFSHVLEHMRDPAVVLANFSRLLSRGGQVLIAVPNILSFRMRYQFLRGDFQYQPSGPMDDTHLRFFTYLTADRYLLAETSDLTVTHKTVKGSVPLWLLRRHILPNSWRERIDEWGDRRWPNLFGGQVLIRAVKQ